MVPPDRFSIYTIPSPQRWEISLMVPPNRFSIYTIPSPQRWETSLMAPPNRFSIYTIPSPQRWAPYPTYTSASHNIPPNTPFPTDTPDRHTCKQLTNKTHIHARLLQILRYSRYTNTQVFKVYTNTQVFRNKDYN